MSLFVVLIFMALWGAVFIWFSIRVGNFANAITPSLIAFFPAYFIFECIYLFWVENDEHWLEYVFIYTCALLLIVSFVVGYMMIPGSFTKVKRVYVYNPRYLHCSIIFTIAAVFLYLPVLIEYKQYILYPRVIYELTRSGYGHLFYSSLLAGMLAVVFSFYSLSRARWVSILLLVVNVVFILLHGNKTPLLNLIVAWLFFYSYVLGNAISMKKMFYVVAIISCFIFLFFYLTFNSELSIVLLNMAYYADYNRNAFLLMNGNIDFGFGKYIVESQVFSRLPRFLYPDKPEFFGYLELAKSVFPNKTEENVGVPSFGLGEYYADFGYFSLLVIPVVGFFKGVLTGYVKKLLDKQGDVYYLLIFLFLSGVTFIPLGSGWLFYEHCFLALLIYGMLKLKFKLN